MKINVVSSVSFKGKIIDAHLHYGKLNGKSYSPEHLDQFIGTPLHININGAPKVDTVEKGLVSSLSAIGLQGRLNEVDSLNECVELFGENRNIGILAVAQPNLTEGQCAKLDKAIKKHAKSVVGLKFHPTDLKEDITGKDVDIKETWYDPYLKMAKKRNLPCLFHSDDNRSTPRTIYELAKRHKGTPVILGHCGGGKFEEALNVLKESLKNKDAKLYCDISWLDWGADTPGFPPKHPNKVIQLIRELKNAEGGLDRILFGTDAPLGCFGENQQDKTITESAKSLYERTITNIKSEIKRQFGAEADDIIEKIFYKNSNELFFKKSWAKRIKDTARLKTFAGVVVALAALAGGAHLAQNPHN